MKKIYNFAAGPATLPEDVLKKAASEISNYRGSSISVMELSHRSDIFTELLNDAKAILAELLNLRDDVEILFLQGGASTQFAMVPLNIMNKSKKADFLITGNWSKKAYQEASKYGDARIIATSEDKDYSYIPKTSYKDYRDDADYIHICTNNTIYGTRISPDKIIDSKNIPLVADMSSNILSEVYDMSKFDLVFAGAQKNMGPAGVTIVIIKKDLIGNARDITPTMLDYKSHAEKNSCYNTPPAYNIYMCKLVYEWLKSMGGVKEIQKINEKKAKILYDCLDNSKIFRATANREDRSIMNVTFVSPSKEIDTKFISKAKEEGLEYLKGHRSIGGMRASIYNAMPIEGVEKLVDFIEKFQTREV